MKFFETFSLTKLCAALQQKDWKEVEKKQNILELEQFLARRGVGSIKTCSHCVIYFIIF